MQDCSLGMSVILLVLFSKWRKQKITDQFQTFKISSSSFILHNVLGVNGARYFSYIYSRIIFVLPSECVFKFLTMTLYYASYSVTCVLKLNFGDLAVLIYRGLFNFFPLWIISYFHILFIQFWVFLSYKYFIWIKPLNGH